MAYSFLNNLCMKTNENSSWFASNKHLYKKYLTIDLFIRSALLKFKPGNYYILKFSIEILKQNEVQKGEINNIVNVHVICYKKFRNIDVLVIKKDILNILKKYKSKLDISYINVYIQFANNPYLYSEYIAKYISSEMSRRIGQRKLVFIAESCIINGGVGCIIQIKGRVNGYGMTRKYSVTRGYISRNTLKNDVEMYRHTHVGKSGTVGIKVFVNRGSLIKK
ncbi:30S ribosomal protein S3 [bacterium AB1]|nr:30S ribosomal protein S3 [bacterium AB1]